MRLGESSIVQAGGLSPGACVTRYSTRCALPELEAEAREPPTALEVKTALAPRRPLPRPSMLKLRNSGEVAESCASMLSDVKRKSSPVVVCAVSFRAATEEMAKAPAVLRKSLR